MKLCVIVLAYRAPSVLLHHAKYLSELDFIVHIDAKADIAEFAEIAALPNVTILPQRLAIFWGGWRMVEATILLMRAGLRAGADRIAFISDDSFTLRPVAELLQLFDDDRQWISTIKGHGEIYRRYAKYYYMDTRVTHPVYCDPFEREFTPDMLDAMLDLNKLARTGKKELPLICHGSQWWCLTRDVIEYILRIHQEDEQLAQSFRFSLIPDEMYFQTILGNAPTPWRTELRFMWAEFGGAVVPRGPKHHVSVDSLQAARVAGFPFIRKLVPAVAEILAGDVSDAAKLPAEATPPDP